MLRRHQPLPLAFAHGAEGFIGWCENGERSFAAERFFVAGALDSFEKRAELTGGGGDIQDIAVGIRRVGGSDEETVARLRRRYNRGGGEQESGEAGAKECVGHGWETSRARLWFHARVTGAAHAHRRNWFHVRLVTHRRSRRQSLRSGG
jgi:hypothetical protein